MARGPFGRWTYDGSDARAVLVSGGTGVTPFRAMCLLKRDKGTPGALAVLCSAKTPEPMLYRAEHDAWRGAGVDVRTTFTGAGGKRLSAADALAAGGPGAVYYLCGPAKMVQELREGLEKAGVPAAQVRTEKWGDYSDLFS